MHPCREFRRRKVATHPSLPLEGSRRDGLRHQRCTCCATHGTHAFRKAVPSLSVTYGRKGELQHNTQHKRLSAGDNSTASHHPCCQTTTDLPTPMATVADPKRLFKRNVSVFHVFFSCNLPLTACTPFNVALHTCDSVTFAPQQLTPNTKCTAKTDTLV